MTFGLKIAAAFTGLSYYCRQFTRPQDLTSIPDISSLCSFGLLVLEQIVHVACGRPDMISNYLARICTHLRYTLTRA